MFSECLNNKESEFKNKDGEDSYNEVVEDIDVHEEYVLEVTKQEKEIQSETKQTLIKKL